REVKPETHILAPENSPVWVKNREILWNEIERSEKRKNSQLAREINIALPKELSNQQQTELIKGYIQDQFVDKGMVADIAIHRDDSNNPHAHIMLTTREISEEGFTTKNRDWNKKELLEQWREQWSEYANKALEQSNIKERITHKSHAERGLEILPTVHMGHVASDMEKKGMKTERGNINREVQKHNAIVYDLQRYRQEKQQIEAELKQQEQKKSVELTTEEQKNVEAAKQIIGEIPTVATIANYRKSLEVQTEQQRKALESLKTKNHIVSIAEQAEKQLSHYEKTLEELKGKLDKVGFFQRKEKENLRASINTLQDKIISQHDHLNTCLKEAGLSAREEIQLAKKQLSKQIDTSTRTLNGSILKSVDQKQILNQTEEILKQKLIRKVAIQYPELKTAGQYLDYKTASKLNRLNEKQGKTISLDNIKHTLEQRQHKIELNREGIQNYNLAVRNAQNAESYFNHLTELEKRIERIESNPYLKGKILFSKEEQQAYQKDLQKREQLTQAIRTIGYEDREHLEQHKREIEKVAPALEKVQQETQSLSQSNDFLSAILEGVEQAQKQEHKVNAKQKPKQRLKGQNIGLER
ncbi:MobQ family relaxase, partial [Streptomyces globisporus]